MPRRKAIGSSPFKRQFSVDEDDLEASSSVIKKVRAESVASLSPKEVPCGLIQPHSSFASPEITEETSQSNSTLSAEEHGGKDDGGGDIDGNETPDTNSAATPGGRNLSLEALFQVTDTELQAISKQGPVLQDHSIDIENDGNTATVFVVDTSSIGEHQELVYEQVEEKEHDPRSQSNVFHSKLPENTFKTDNKEGKLARHGNEEDNRDASMLSSSSSEQPEENTQAHKQFLQIEKILQKAGIDTSGKTWKTLTRPGRHICPYCQKGCAKPSVLEKHIRAHTGERPYPCIVCRISFKTKSNLYKHCKSHTHKQRVNATSNSCSTDSDFDGSKELVDVTAETSDKEEDAKQTGDHAPKHVIQEVLKYLGKDKGQRPNEVQTERQRARLERLKSVQDRRSGPDVKKLKETKLLHRQMSLPVMPSRSNQLPKIAPKKTETFIEDAVEDQQANYDTERLPSNVREDLIKGVELVQSSNVEMLEMVTHSEEPEHSGNEPLSNQIQIVTLPDTDTDPETATRALRELENMSEKFSKAHKDGVKSSMKVHRLVDKRVQVVLEIQQLFPNRAKQGDEFSGSHMANAPSTPKSISTAALKERIQQLISANEAIVDTPRVEPPRAKATKRNMSRQEEVTPNASISETESAAFNIGTSVRNVPYTQTLSYEKDGNYNLNFNNLEGHGVIVEQKEQDGDCIVIAHNKMDSGQLESNQAVDIQPALAQQIYSAAPIENINALNVSENKFDAKKKPFNGTTTTLSNIIQTPKTLALSQHLHTENVQSSFSTSRSIQKKTTKPQTPGILSPVFIAPKIEAATSQMSTFTIAPMSSNVMPASSAVIDSSSGTSIGNQTVHATDINTVQSSLKGAVSSHVLNVRSKSLPGVSYVSVIQSPPPAAVPSPTAISFVVPGNEGQPVQYIVKYPQHNMPDEPQMAPLKNSPMFVRAGSLPIMLIDTPVTPVPSAQEGQSTDIQSRVIVQNRPGVPSNSQHAQSFVPSQSVSYSIPNTFVVPSSQPITRSTQLHQVPISANRPLTQLVGSPMLVGVTSPFIQSKTLPIVSPVQDEAAATDPMTILSSIVSNTVTQQLSDSSRPDAKEIKIEIKIPPSLQQSGNLVQVPPHNSAVTSTMPLHTKPKPVLKRQNPVPMTTSPSSPYPTTNLGSLTKPVFRFQNVTSSMNQVVMPTQTLTGPVFRFQTARTKSLGDQIVTKTVPLTDPSVIKDFLQKGQGQFSSSSQSQSGVTGQSSSVVVDLTAREVGESRKLLRSTSEKGVALYGSCECEKCGTSFKKQETLALHRIYYCAFRESDNLPEKLSLQSSEYKDSPKGKEINPPSREPKLSKHSTTLAKNKLFEQGWYVIDRPGTGDHVSTEAQMIKNSKSNAPHSIKEKIKALHTKQPEPTKETCLAKLKGQILKRKLKGKLLLRSVSVDAGESKAKEELDPKHHVPEFDTGPTPVKKSKLKPSMEPVHIQSQNQNASNRNNFKRSDSVPMLPKRQVSVMDVKEQAEREVIAEMTREGDKDETKMTSECKLVVGQEPLVNVPVAMAQPVHCDGTSSRPIYQQNYRMKHFSGMGTPPQMLPSAILTPRPDIVEVVKVKSKFNFDLSVTQPKEVGGEVLLSQIAKSESASGNIKRSHSGELPEAIDTVLLQPNKPLVAPVTSPSIKSPGALIKSPSMKMYSFTGHAQPTLRSLTHMTFCCIDRLQPVYVCSGKNKKVSMYSNWCNAQNNTNPFGLSTKKLLSLYNSRYSTNPVWAENSGCNANGGIITHSSYWKYKQQRQKESRRDSTAHVKMDTQQQKRPDKGKSTNDNSVSSLQGGYKSFASYVYVRGRGRGRYVCETCGIRCKKPSMLKKHIRTHTDLRPYKCKYCKFSFKTKGNLTKHMKSKTHQRKCVELGIFPIPTTVDETQIDSAALKAQCLLSKKAKIYQKQSEISVEEFLADSECEEEEEVVVDEEGEGDEEENEEDPDGGQEEEEVDAKETVATETVAMPGYDGNGTNEVQAVAFRKEVDDASTSSNLSSSQMERNIFLQTLGIIAKQMGTSDKPFLAPSSLSNVGAVYGAIDIPTSTSSIAVSSVTSTTPQVLASSLSTIYGNLTSNKEDQMATSRDKEIIWGLLNLSDQRLKLKDSKLEVDTGSTDELFNVLPASTTSCTVKDHLVNPPSSVTLVPSTGLKTENQVSISVAGFLPPLVTKVTGSQDEAGSPTASEPIIGQLMGTFEAGPGDMKLVEKTATPLPPLHHPFSTTDLSLEQAISSCVSIVEPARNEGTMTTTSCQTKMVSPVPKVPKVTQKRTQEPATQQFIIENNARSSQPVFIEIGSIQAQIVNVDPEVFTSNTPTLNKMESLGDDSVTNLKIEKVTSLSNLHEKNMFGKNSDKPFVSQTESKIASSSQQGASPVSIATSMVTQQPSAMNFTMPQRVVGSVTSGSADRVNTETSMFMCSLCTAVFPEHHQLIFHGKLHLMEVSRIKCDKCNLKFRSHATYEKHLLSDLHLGENLGETLVPTTDNPRPFKCELCDTAFRVRGHLTKHFRSRSHFIRLEELDKLPLGTWLKLEHKVLDLEATNLESFLKKVQILLHADEHGIDLASLEMAASYDNRYKHKEGASGARMSPYKDVSEDLRNDLHNDLETPKAGDHTEKVKVEMNKETIEMGSIGEGKEVTFSANLGEEIPSDDLFGLEIVAETNEGGFSDPNHQYPDQLDHETGFENQSFHEGTHNWDNLGTEHMSSTKEVAMETADDSLQASNDSTVGNEHESFISSVSQQDDVTIETKSTISDSSKQHLNKSKAFNDGAETSFSHLTCGRKAVNDSSDAKEVKYGLCTQGFGAMSSLKTHLIKKAELRPYVCEYCDAGFTNAQSLKIHLNTHTKEAPYVCGMCGMKFVSSDYLWTHSKDSHQWAKSDANGATNPQSSIDSATNSQPTINLARNPKTTIDGLGSPQCTIVCVINPQSTIDSAINSQATIDSATSPQSDIDSATDSQSSIASVTVQQSSINFVTVDHSNTGNSTADCVTSLHSSIDIVSDEQSTIDCVSVDRSNNGSVSIATTSTDCITNQQSTVNCVPVEPSNTSCDPTVDIGADCITNLQYSIDSVTDKQSQMDYVVVLNNEIDCDSNDSVSVTNSNLHEFSTSDPDSREDYVPNMYSSIDCLPSTLSNTDSISNPHSNIYFAPYTHSSENIPSDSHSLNKGASDTSFSTGHVPIALSSLDSSPKSLSSKDSLSNSLSSTHCVTNTLSSIDSLPNTLSSIVCVPNTLSSTDSVTNTISNEYIQTLSSIDCVPNTLSSIDCVPNTLSSIDSVPNTLSSTDSVTNTISNEYIQTVSNSDKNIVSKAHSSITCDSNTHPIGEFTQGPSGIGDSKTYCAAESTIYTDSSISHNEQIPTSTTATALFQPSSSAMSYYRRDYPESGPKWSLDDEGIQSSEIDSQTDSFIENYATTGSAVNRSSEFETLVTQSDIIEDRVQLHNVGNHEMHYGSDVEAGEVTCSSSIDTEMMAAEDLQNSSDDNSD